MSFTQILEKRMFLLVLITIIFLGYLGDFGNYGINRTVNWTVNLATVFVFFKKWLHFGFLLGYSLLALLKQKTFKYLSLTHLFVILFIYVIDDLFTIDIRLYMAMQCFSTLLFLVNFCMALVSPKSLKLKK